MTTAPVPREATLSFAGQEIGVKVADGVTDRVAPVLSFAQPHFELTAGTPSKPDTVIVEFLSHNDWSEPQIKAERTLVRRRTPGKHVWGSRWRRHGRTLLHVPSSGTIFDLADDGSHARVFVGDRSRYHASDLLRDMMWELAAPGGTFVHAAAVSDGNSVIAFTGPKGAGKTTTAVDFVYAGAEFYTGDVLFVSSDRNDAYSFPDYPHMGWGSLRTYPELLDIVLDLGLKPDSDDQKVLLPHDLYHRALGTRQGVPPQPLRAVVIPDLNLDDDPVLAAADPRPEYLEPMDRQTSDPGEGWEPFLTSVARWSTARRIQAPRLPEVAWYTRKGRGRLPKDEIATVLH